MLTRIRNLRAGAHLQGNRRPLRRLALARHLIGAQSGVEIGGLNHPLLPGWPIWPRPLFVDRYDTATLRERYPELAGQPIVDVALVADAHKLPFRDETQDFIIANHVIEHMENVFANLKDYHRILRPGGKLYAALPDWTHSWDRPRERTTYDHLLTEYLRPETVRANRYAHYVDWTRAFAGTHHTDIAADDEARIHAHARHLMDIDNSIHFHVWRGSDFVAHIAQMSRDLDFGFEVVAASLVEDIPPERLDYGEFIVVLQKR